MNDKVVITCALTGVLSDPKQHPVPVTPAEMAREARKPRSMPARLSCMCIFVSKRLARVTCRHGTRSWPRPSCKRSATRVRT